MKLWKQGILLLILLAVLFVACGCQEKNPVIQDPGAIETTDPEPTEDPRQVELREKYNSAVELVTGEDLSLKVDMEKTVTVAGHSYEESNEYELNYWNMGTEEFVAKTNQEVSFGNDDYELKIKEVYSDGVLYQKLGDNKFSAELTVEDFTDRYVPLQMLDPMLYTLSADEGDAVISFEGAAAGEEWALPEEAVLTRAAGTAELDEDGKLVCTTYEVEFQYGTANFLIEYEVSVEKTGKAPTLKEDPEDYTKLENIDTAYIVEHAYGYLSQAEHISSDCHMLTVSAAGGMSLLKNTDVDVYSVGDTYAMRWEDSYNLTDYSTGDSIKQESEEKFIDDVFTISYDGGEPETKDFMKRSLVKDAVVEYLVQGFTDSRHFAELELTNLGSLLLVECTGTELLAKEMADKVCYGLFGQPVSVLDDMASSYETKEMSYYVALDSYSLLPTAMGMKYEGVHIIQGEECPLSYQVDQSFDLASLTSHDAIFEEPAPEEAPENPATPLFYRVTGADGQEMWLLGTIHIGDVRTGFLPQEIYDAFYSSDAFAIECNSEAFSEQVEEDEKLQEIISDCYYYGDGTLTKEHIVTEDLYETAVQMLKATGNYFFNTEYEMTHLWSSYLDNYYLQQGYALTSEKGVENRLMALAEEAEIPIWEVESVQFQMEMVANYSEHLQEFLLYGSMASGAKENWESSLELYELWCAGDEAALTEKIVGEEKWEILEEDIDLESLEGEDLERAQAVLADLENINAQLAALQEEYEKAMSYDRNEGMLEVAKQYLESGDTVFYAVGLAHLLAENGLVKTLQDAGYTVELVSYQ